MALPALRPSLTGEPITWAILRRFSAIIMEKLRRIGYTFLECKNQDFTFPYALKKMRIRIMSVRF